MITIDWLHSNAWLCEFSLYSCTFNLHSNRKLFEEFHPQTNERHFLFTFLPSFLILNVLPKRKRFSICVYFFVYVIFFCVLIAQRLFLRYCTNSDNSILLGSVYLSRGPLTFEVNMVAVRVSNSKMNPIV